MSSSRMDRSQHVHVSQRYGSQEYLKDRSGSVGDEDGTRFKVTQMAPKHFRLNHTFNTSGLHHPGGVTVTETQVSRGPGGENVTRHTERTEHHSTVRSDDQSRLGSGMAGFNKSSAFDHSASFTGRDGRFFSPPNETGYQVTEETTTKRLSHGVPVTSKLELPVSHDRPGGREASFESSSTFERLGSSQQQQQQQLRDMSAKTSTSSGLPGFSQQTQRYEETRVIGPARVSSPVSSSRDDSSRLLSHVQRFMDETDRSQVTVEQRNRQLEDLERTLSNGAAQVQQQTQQPGSLAGSSLMKKGDLLDMDVTYITERIIVMSFLGEGMESDYKANQTEVTKMLRSKHGDHYMVLNLSEKRNDLKASNLHVQEFGWPDRLAPALDQLCSICKAIDTWLAGDPQNVAVLHCKGGKNRIGVVVAAYMHYSNICASADQALDRFAMKRFHDDKYGGSTHPSQKRYVHYFAGMLSGSIKLNSKPLYLHHIVIHGVPDFDGRGSVCPFIKVYQGMTPIYTSPVFTVQGSSRRLVISLEEPLQLRGDVFVKCYHRVPQASSREVIFRTQFHTCAVNNYGLTINKRELDEACLDPRFPEHGKVEYLFSPTAEKVRSHDLLNETRVTVDQSPDLIVRWDSYEGFNTIPEDERNSKLAEKSKANVSEVKKRYEYSELPSMSQSYTTLNKTPHTPYSPNGALSPDVTLNRSRGGSRYDVNAEDYTRTTNRVFHDVSYANGGPPPVATMPNNGQPPVGPPATRGKPPPTALEQSQLDDILSELLGDQQMSDNLGGDWKTTEQYTTTQRQGNQWKTTQHIKAVKKDVAYSGKTTQRTEMDYERPPSRGLVDRSKPHVSDDRYRETLTIHNADRFDGYREEPQQKAIEPPKQAPPPQKEPEDFITLQPIGIGVQNVDPDERAVTPSFPTDNQSQQNKIPAKEKETYSDGQSGFNSMQRPASATPMLQQSQMQQQTPFDPTYASIQDTMSRTPGSSRVFVFPTQQQQQQQQQQQAAFKQEIRKEFHVQQHVQNVQQGQSFAPHQQQQNFQQQQAIAAPMAQQGGMTQQGMTQQEAFNESSMQQPVLPIAQGRASGYNTMQSQSGQSNFGTMRSGYGGGQSGGGGGGGTFKRQQSWQTSMQRDNKGLDRRAQTPQPYMFSNGPPRLVKHEGTLSGRSRTPGPEMFMSRQMNGSRHNMQTAGTWEREAGGNFGQQAGTSGFSQQTGTGTFGQQTGNTNFNQQTSSGNYGQKTGSSSFSQQRETGNFGQQATPMGPLQLGPTPAQQQQQQNMMTQQNVQQQNMVQQQPQQQQQQFGTLGGGGGGTTSHSESYRYQSSSGGGGGGQMMTGTLPMQQQRGMLEVDTGMNTLQSNASMRQDAGTPMFPQSGGLMMGYGGQGMRKESFSSAMSEGGFAQTPRFQKDTHRYWYRPGITREEAINYLKTQAPGSFVVRDSNSFPGAFGLAVKVAQLPPGVQPKPGADPQAELVRHFLIEPTSRGVRLKGCSNEPVFGTLAALVYQHTITPLALPCKLVLPETDPMTPDFEGQRTMDAPSTAQALLNQGAACNVLYITSVDTESLTGPQAVARAVSLAFDTTPQSKVTNVHFKVSGQGITMTDQNRKLFFRRHCNANAVTFCGMDPEDRRWQQVLDNGVAVNAKMFGFVARKNGSSMHNECHVFAELDPDQPASAIVNFVTKVMIGYARK